MNLVIVSGRLGHDPESIEKGQSFSLAVQDINTVHWVKVLDFTNCKNLQKGSKVLVKGRIIETDPVKLVAERIEYV